MTNTQKRVLSALVLATIVGLCSFKGASAVLGLILVVGLICVDEFYCNFLKRDRDQLHYWSAQFSFLAIYTYCNFISFSPALLDIFVNAGIFLDLVLVFYIFKMPMELKILNEIKAKYSYLAGVFFLLPLMSLASLIHYGNWLSLLCILLFVNFGMDIGAWFFGRNFGKHKLWPSVSPNKTIEGLVGGILVSSFVGSLLWWFLFDKISLVMPMFFALLGGFSQIGDLIQSKLKRQCQIKDSSSLIPGHGGFYDRIDSLVFLSPIYATAMRYIYF